MNQVNSALGTFSCCRTNLLHPAHDSISSPVTTLDMFPQTAFGCPKKDLKYTRKFGIHPSLVWSTNDRIVNWGSFEKVGCGCSPNRFCWPEQNKSVFLGLNTHPLLLASKPPGQEGKNTSLHSLRTKCFRLVLDRMPTYFNTTNTWKSLILHVIQMNTWYSTSYVQILDDPASAHTLTGHTRTRRFGVSIIKPLFLWADFWSVGWSITHQTQGTALAQTTPQLV